MGREKLTFYFCNIWNSLEEENDLPQGKKHWLELGQACTLILQLTDFQTLEFKA